MIFVYFLYDSKDEISKEHALFLNFVKGCLTIDPNSRMTASEAVLHPLFKDLNKRK